MMTDRIKSDFPQLKSGHSYLDSAAMSLKPSRVIETIDDYYRRLSVNVHRGLYDASVEATKMYEASRDIIAAFINASREETIFTRGTTDSLNMIALALSEKFVGPEDEIITSELEHHSSFLPWQVIAMKKGAALRFVPLNEEGRISVENFKKVLCERTKIVALTYVSNVMGYVTPIEEITRLAHEVGAIVIVDAAQAVPHFTVDVKKIDADFLAFSGHKMLGPTGIGILYGKKKWLEMLEPVEYGGDMNEEVGKELSTWKEPPYRYEAGTMPVAEAIGLGEAVKCLEDYGMENIARREKEVLASAISRMKKIDGVEIYNQGTDTGIIAFNLKNVPSHDAVSFYAENGVDIRAGHHCAQLVTKWLGIPSCLRASFYLYSDESDAIRLAEVTEKAVGYFQSLGF